MKDKIDLIFSDLKNEVITEKQAHQQVLDLFAVMPSLPDGLDDDSNCDHNFKLGWIACWKAFTGNEA